MKYINNLPKRILVITLKDPVDDDLLVGAFLSKRSAEHHLRCFESDPNKQVDSWYEIEEVPLHGEPVKKVIITSQEVNNDTQL